MIPIIRYTRKEEAERCITIKPTEVSLYYEYDVKGTGTMDKFLINLITHLVMLISLLK